MKDYINLLPASYRWRCLLWRRLRAWSIAWTVVAICLTAVWLDERAQWEAVIDQVESQEQRYDELRSLKSEIVRLAAQKQAFGKQQTLVVQLQQAPPPLLPVALVSASAARCDGRVGVRQLTYRQEPITQQPATAPAPGQPAGQPAAAAVDSRLAGSSQLTIDGLGVDNVAIAEFVEGLRESGAFHRVDLKSAAANTTPAGKAISYQVECGL